MKKLEIIRYHNDFKSVNINHLTLQEAKIFIKLIQEVQNKQDEILNISFEDFKNVLNQNFTNEELEKVIDSSVRKTISSYIVITNKEEKTKTYFTFFNKFKIDLAKKIVIAQVNKEFLYIINELIKNYSTLLLSEAIQFKSKYSLLMYKKIREFYKQEKLELNLDNFKEYMGLKDIITWTYINDKVLFQIAKELPKIITNLKIYKVKKYKTAPVEKLIFTWKYENNKDKVNQLNNKN